MFQILIGWFILKNRNKKSIKLKRIHYFLIVQNEMIIQWLKLCVVYFGSESLKIWRSEIKLEMFFKIYFFFWLNLKFFSFINVQFSINFLRIRSNNFIQRLETKSLKEENTFYDFFVSNNFKRNAWNKLFDSSLYFPLTFNVHNEKKVLIQIDSMKFREGSFVLERFKVSRMERMKCFENISKNDLKLRSRKGIVDVGGSKK